MINKKQPKRTNFFCKYSGIFIFLFFAVSVILIQTSFINDSSETPEDFDINGSFFMNFSRVELSQQDSKLKIQKEFESLQEQIIPLNKINGSKVNYRKGDKFEDKLKEVIGISKVSLNTNLTFEELHHKIINIKDERYTREFDDMNGGEYIQTPYQMFENDFQSDCDEYALLLYMIAKEMGLEVKYVVGYREIDKETKGHAWIQINRTTLNGEHKIYEYDSTSNIICSTNCISEMYYNIIYVGDSLK